MAQKVLIELVDDIDGNPGDDVSTVQFGLDGVTYEIDLRDDNSEKLRNSLSEFVGSARRVGGRLRRGTKLSTGNSTGSSEAGQIREWANANGFELSARGRIPGHVVDAYRQAQAESNGNKSKPHRSASGSGRGRTRAKAT